MNVSCFSFFFTFNQNMQNMCETEIFYLYAILPKPRSGCEIYEKDKWKFMSLGDKIALTQFKLRFFVIEKAGN